MTKLKFLSCLIILTGFFEALHAQSSRSQNNKIQPIPLSRQLELKEDSLQLLSDSMINAAEPQDRFRADSNFVKMLVRALKIKNSFSHPFDSLKTISRLYAPDSSFRIITWQLKKDEYVYLQKGAIQMHTSDGELKLYPLFDYSMFTAKPADSARTKDNWIGAIYYRMVMKEAKGKKYYTLLGFDDFSVSSNKKWIEVLSFDENNQPVFGGPLISFREDTAKLPVQARYCMEYKKEASTVLNYDPDMDMIVFDHLISESDEPERKSTYIPDGTYEGFKWKNGQWVHVNKLFNFSLEDGQFPVDEKLRDEKGNINEEKLEEASRKNMEKTK